MDWPMCRGQWPSSFPNLLGTRSVQYPSQVTSEQTINCSRCPSGASSAAVKRTTVTHTPGFRISESASAATILPQWRPSSRTLSATPSAVETRTRSVEHSGGWMSILLVSCNLKYSIQIEEPSAKCTLDVWCLFMTFSLQRAPVVKLT